MIDVICDLDKVQARCAGQLVADHDRSWTWAQNVTDPAHVASAKGLRRAFRIRQRATAAPAQTVVRAGDVVAAGRALSDYDTVFAALAAAAPEPDNAPPCAITPATRHLRLVGR